VKVTRGAAVFVALVYVFLWVLALRGVSSLIPLLAVPLVLALLVAFGVWLNRFMGITPRRQHFVDRADDDADGSGPPVPGDGVRDVGARGGADRDESGDAPG